MDFVGARAGGSMGQYRIVHSAVHAVLAYLAYWIVTHDALVTQLLRAAVGSLQDALPVLEQKEVMAGSVFTGLALLFKWSDKFANALVEKLRLLRRVISGREFVEGDWPLFVYDMAKQKLLYLGFLTITFKDGHIYVFGDDWQVVDGSGADGETKVIEGRSMKFRSKQSHYKDSVLHYWYEQGMSIHEPDMRGYTEIYFFPHHSRLGLLGRADRHAGRFLDPNHPDTRFYAERIAYSWFQRRIKTDKAKIAAAREFWERHRGRIEDMKATEIKADFV